MAYKVEAPEGSTVEVSAESSIDISAFLANGDIKHGEKVFKKCAACHSVTQDGGNKIGPKLWNVMFRPVASITDYKYSKGLLDYKKEWSWGEMNGFLWWVNRNYGFLCRFHINVK